MGRVSFVVDLPDDIQSELETMIAAGKSVVRITEWLNGELSGRGLETVPYTTVNYNVQKKRGEFQARAQHLRDTEAKANAIARVFQNAGAPVNIASVRLFQTELMDAMSDIKIDTAAPLKPAEVQAISRALKNLVELEAAMQTQYEDNLRRIADRAKLVAGEVEQLAKGDGMSDDVVEQIMTKLLNLQFIPGDATPND